MTREAGFLVIYTYGCVLSSQSREALASIKVVDGHFLRPRQFPRFCLYLPLLVDDQSPPVVQPKTPEPPTETRLI